MSVVISLLVFLGLPFALFIGCDVVAEHMGTAGSSRQDIYAASSDYAFIGAVVGVVLAVVLILVNYAWAKWW